MEEATALRVALQLLHMPSNARLVRDRPLPAGMPLLLRVAAGDADAVGQATALTDRPPETLQKAARFFIEQAMWHGGADSFRVLGAHRDANPTELKRNMALLMMWLHPDHDTKDDRTIFATRVTNAWNDLKTPDRREQYAAHRTLGAEKEAQRRRRARRQREQAARLKGRKRGVVRWLFSILMGRPLP